MLPSPVRRAVLPALIVLAFGLLPLGLAAPATASADCTSEQGIFPVQCDDEVPPETTSAAVDFSSGIPTVLGSGDQGAQQGLDTDPVGVQCSLDGGTAWGACGAMPGLPIGSYTVLVRAVDTADDAIDVPCDFLTCGPEVPDFDPSPTAVAFFVGPGGGGVSGPDGDPETQISGAPQDRLTPGSPVALTRKPQVFLASSEPATFNCAVNAHKIPCQAGINKLKGLKPGNQTLVAQAVDKQGNFDATPASITFYVPINLRPGPGDAWRKIKSKGAYAGDLASTSAQGAVLTVASVKGVREVRLIASTGPNLGKVAVRVGKGKWKKVSLKSAKSRTLQVFVIRAPGSGPVSGKVQIQALKVPQGGAVAVDALVAR